MQATRKEHHVCYVIPDFKRITQLHISKTSSRVHARITTDHMGHTDTLARLYTLALYNTRLVVISIVYNNKQLTTAKRTTPVIVTEL